MLELAFSSEASKEYVITKHDLFRCTAARRSGRCGLVVVRFCFDAGTDDAAVRREPVGAREVDRTREVGDVVDAMEDAEVAGDVLRVVEGPVNLGSSLFEADELG